MTESPRDPAAGEPEFDKISFRNALGQFATGVTIITAISKDGTPVVSLPTALTPPPWTRHWCCGA
jgi:flavin reductase (DIM6/NTAB) family NADH-FMN oxidoreductase RutF